MVQTLRLIVQPNEPGVFFEVPAEVVAALGAGKRPAVRVTVNGFEHRTRIAVYGGRSLVGFRRDVRAAAQLDPGQEVELTLELDDDPRDVALPADFAAALAVDADARVRYDALSYTNRKEYVDWLLAAKRPETRQRRLDDATTLLKSGRRTPLGA
jgi:Bacteriocin-protection, YdeI or OmpD-Associated/Domain of unknown function (DUF1905)